MHVHPFKTKCVIPESNNEWFDFFKTVAKSDISAIGITDYFKFDIHIAFEKAKAEFLEDSQKFSQLEKRYQSVSSELTSAEKGAAEGKNWKTDLSGGIQRVAIKHNCAPFGKPVVPDV